MLQVLTMTSGAQGVEGKTVVACLNEDNMDMCYECIY